MAESRGGLLRLAEPPVLIEQLRLLLSNVGEALVPVILLSITMVPILSNDRNAPSLWIWCAMVILSKALATFEARRLLRKGLRQETAPRVAWEVMALFTADGLAWGALAWVTLDSATMTGNVLVISLTAAIAGSSLSSLAPVLQVYIAFAATIMLTLALKLWTTGDTAYEAIGALAFLYVPMLYSTARNSAKAAQDAIALRFENVDLIERLRVESEKARAAHREAEDANLAKSKFLAAASHDLRQPIHAQGLFLEALARSELSPRQRAMLDNAQATSAASAEMLNTLLDFSRVEAGVMEPQVRPFHLQPLLNKIENEMAPQAVDKGLVFRVRETPAAVESDPALVELILRNLVSNAIRYTERGGILMACRKRNEHVVVEVWDTGMGIPTAQIEEVFREFHQLGNPERDRRKGLGLGLAIADRLASAMGLDLAVASVAGRGSVFRLSLPLTRAAVTSEESDAKPYETRMLNARVLVIDDDEAVRVGMLHLLEEWGCECEAVDSIDEALAAARARLPDIVVSDYRLREQHTGMEAIERLRAEFGPDLPALLITGDTIPERLREARACNVPLLHKPVSSLLLNKTLVRVLAGKDL